MPNSLNISKKADQAYKLTLKEYDGKDAFWTGSTPYQSSVECELTESDLHVPIEKVVGTYLVS
jgi:hypothetical protein